MGEFERLPLAGMDALALANERGSEPRRKDENKDCSALRPHVA